MNKRKYVLSSFSMILILLVLAFRQAIRIMELDLVFPTSISNDIMTVGISFIGIIVISLVMYYLPMMLLFKYELGLNVSLSPINFRSNKIYLTKKLIITCNRRYLRLNVIRC